MSKTILITGGAGFIGSNLIKKLIAYNKIIVVDNLCTGNLENLAIFLAKKNFTFLKQDIIKPVKLPAVVKKIDQIYHLACAASPVHYQKDPFHTLQTNFSGTLNIINLALKHDAKMVFSSTSEVYGSPNQHPQSETYWGNVNPNGIRSCYDEGKRVAESLLANGEIQRGLKIGVARIFNTYGEYMNLEDGRVVTNFIHQALKNEPISLYGDGLQTRSFCYISDMVNGIIKLMSFNKELKLKDYDKLLTINLGNPREQTVKSLAEKIIALTNSKSKINFYPLPQDDPPRRKPDINLAQKLLQWEPKVTLEKGLKKLIPHLRKRILAK